MNPHAVALVCDLLLLLAAVAALGFGFLAATIARHLTGKD